jgi:phospholipid transport system substrate-binding protein
VTPAAAGCQGSDQNAALELVKKTTAELFAAVDAYPGKLSENPAKARELVDEYITPHVDLEGFSRLVLGKHWRTATPEQQKEFLEQFHQLILRTYATAVTSYTGTEIQYQPMREESRENFATVRTLIPSTNGESLKVDYRLHCRNDIWKLFDVTIAGVSMVTTYRSTFSAEINRSGVDGLIKVLEQKNKETGA